MKYLDSCGTRFSQRPGSAADDPVLRLIWFHHAGGNGESYHSWEHLFPREWQIVFVEYPGRGVNVDIPLRRNLDLLAGDVMNSLESLLDRPYALFGHSMGSLVALEFARRAIARGLRSPFWLGVSGRHAPHIDVEVRYLIHKLSDQALADVVHSIGGNSMDLLADSRDRASFLDLLRADLEACETYQTAVEPRLDSPLSAYLGTDDTMVTFDQMNAWAALTSGNFHLRRFKGGHFYLTGRKREIAQCIIADVLHEFTMGIGA